MGYTEPPDASPGDTLTAAWLDAYVRANFKSFSDTPSLTWTPAITATSINVTYTLQEGLYIRADHYFEGWVNIVLNAVTNAGTGDYTINLPVDTRVPASGLVLIGRGMVYDVSTTTRQFVSVERSSASTVKLGRDGTSGFVTGTAPITWATGDGIYLHMRFPVA